MRLRTVAELRAIVGAAGAAWSDAQLLAADAHAAGVEQLLLGALIDRRDPAAAQRRQAVVEVASQGVLDRRRVRYARERAARVDRVPGSAAWGSTASSEGR